MASKCNSNNCLIFPHIPKCSGSSLRAQFESSPLKVYFDYDKPPHDKSFFQKECERRNRDASMLDFGAFDLVFGHFPIQRYDKDNYQYIALLRHPIERAISHFFYWKNVLPESNQLALHRNPIISEIKNGNVGFLDFVKSGKCSSIYSSYLGKMPPEKFLLVGFTEKYSTFLDELSKILKTELTTDIRLRKSTKDKLDKNELERARGVLKNDIKLYDLFYEHWT
jgi:hypothetical protein